MTGICVVLHVLANASKRSPQRRVRATLANSESTETLDAPIGGGELNERIDSLTPGVDCRLRLIRWRFTAAGLPRSLWGFACMCHTVEQPPQISNVQ